MTERITLRTNEDAIAYLDSRDFGTEIFSSTDEDGTRYYTREETCRRCGGAGYYPTPRHGACYECNGRPPRYTVKVTALATAKKFRAKELRRGAKERKNARREAEFVAAANEKRAAFDAEFPGFSAELDGKTHNILVDLREKLDKWGSLSEKQVAFARKLIAEANAPKTELEEGRREMTGTILSVKWRDSNYGGAFKMTVNLDDGTRVWGTVPSALETIARDLWNDAYNPGDFEDVFKGATITFTATVSRSDDDVSFGFFKRPSIADKDVSLVWEAPEGAKTEPCVFCDSLRHTSEECPAEAHHARMMEEAHI